MEIKDRVSDVLSVRKILWTHGYVHTYPYH
jgi:hypothetical protein